MIMLVLSSILSKYQLNFIDLTYRLSEYFEKSINYRLSSQLHFPAAQVVVQHPHFLTNPGSNPGWVVDLFFFRLCRSWSLPFSFPLHLQPFVKNCILNASERSKGKGKGKEKEKLDVELWQKRKKIANPRAGNRTWDPFNGKASAAYQAEVQGSISAGAFAIFSVSSKASLPISLSPFPSSSFPFPSPFDLSFALKTHSSDLYHKIVFLRIMITYQFWWSEREESERKVVERDR